MSQIVTTRTTAIAEIPAEPKFSPHLASAVRDVLNPHPAIAGQPVTVPEHTLLEAQATGRLYDCICAPGEFVAWKCWLLPLNAAVRNPQATLDFEAKAHAIASACAAVPVAVLTPVTQRLAMQTFKFFPAAADVHDLLAPIAGPLLTTRRALAQITAAPNLEANKPETAEEIARVGAQLRGLVAELKERRAVRKPWIGYGEAI